MTSSISNDVVPKVYFILRIGMLAVKPTSNEKVWFLNNEGEFGARHYFLHDVILFCYLSFPDLLAIVFVIFCSFNALNVT